MLEQFPILQPGNEVHLTPVGGTLFAGEHMRELDREQAAFLAACDGTVPLERILPSVWSERFGDVKFLVFVSSMLQSGRLALAPRPVPAHPRITGSATAFIPPHMGVELTAACNLLCRHCYRESDASQQGRMATAELLEILGKLADAGLRSVELTGGEPLLHPDFLEILAFCAERVQLVGVLSNGTLVTDAIIEAFVALQDKLLLSISLDGSTAEAHDLRRGCPGAFERTVRAVARLAAAGVKVRVSMCVDEESFADLEATILLARRLGAIGFSYTPVLPFGRGRSWAPPGWNLDGREVLRVEQALAARYKGFLSGLTEEAACSLESGGNCGAGHRTYVMDPRGRIRPCTMYDCDDMVLGNLTTQTPEEVFSHPLAGVFARIPLPSRETCAGCAHSEFCRYCSLRGFSGASMVDDCRWIALPAVREVFEYWQPS